jgi:hypothetical protein
MVDIFNLFNDHTINSWGTRYGNGHDWLVPSDQEYAASTGGHILYSIINPRQARVGIRMIF